MSHRAAVVRRLVCDVAASDAKGAGEGQSVGVEAGLVCGVVHDVPECVVDKKEAVDFLLDAIGVLGAEDEAVSALMGLDLVQGVLDLPALMVEARQVGRRGLLRVADGRDQPVDRVVVLTAEGVLDDADPDRFPALAVARILTAWRSHSDEAHCFCHVRPPSTQMWHALPLESDCDTAEQCEPVIGSDCLGDTLAIHRPHHLGAAVQPFRP